MWNGCLVVVILSPVIGNLARAAITIRTIIRIIMSCEVF